MSLLQLLGISCSCYSNKCITKIWAPALTFSIYTWFYWNCFNNVLYNSFKYSIRHYKLKFIILNSYKNVKLIDLNTQLNPVESFRADCSSDFSLSCQFLMLSMNYLNIIIICYDFFLWMFMAMKQNICPVLHAIMFVQY